MKFSVLMSVYHKEQPDYLDRALVSLQEQTLPADEIVIVEDGPLNEKLYDVLESWQDKLPIKRVPLKENIGLGGALAAGLLECSHDIVARMDTDDICDQTRFKKQIQFMKGNPEVGIIGSAITEFEGNESNIYCTREVPVTHEEIVAYAKNRNPFNHMTVMYKKSEVLNVGNYQPCPNFEDYYLWARMLNSGTKAANLETPLVNARAGAGMISRRGGFKYITSEWAFQKKLHSLGFISTLKMIKNNLIRTAFRVVPASLRKSVYGVLLRNNV